MAERTGFEPIWVTYLGRINSKKPIPVRRLVAYGAKSSHPRTQTRDTNSCLCDRLKTSTGWQG